MPRWIQDRDGEGSATHVPFESGVSHSVGKLNRWVEFHLGTEPGKIIFMGSRVYDYCGRFTSLPYE